MVPSRTLRTIVVGHALLTGLLMVAVGCGSVSPLNADGGSAGTGGGGRDASMTTGGGGQGGGNAGTSGQAGATGQGGHGGVAGTGAGGQGGVAGVSGAGSCNTDSDCVYRPGSCCNGTCAAKTDPLPPPGPLCGIACPAVVPSCGCVNHQCANAAVCAPTGPCQFCPNGYLTGPGGCPTCQCKPGDAGTGGGSPGSVTLRIVIPTSQSFCDQTTGCSSAAHITILNAAGQGLELSIPWCSTTCSTACTPSPCPGIACFNQGIAVKTGDLTWDGTSITGSTCGNHVSCYQPGFAPAGHYVARMCATPGKLATADGGFQSTCTATGPMECVDVPFDFPGPSPIVGTLP